jgi:photosystem II stability/assembly factor-like uncharacterized protein
VNARVFLAITGKGVARAVRDDQDAWAVHNILADQDVRCIQADPHHSGGIVAGTQGAGLLRSGDGGVTWEAAGLEGQIVKSVAFSPTEPGVMYAGAKPPMVFVSRDGGETWAESESFRDIPGRKMWFSPAEPPGTAYVQGLAVSPTDPDVVLAGIEFGAVVRSEDGGQTWSKHRREAVRDCHTLTFHHTEGRWAYEGGGGGAAFSRDGGATWSQPRQGLDRRYGWAVAADPADPDVWYFSASPGPGKAHGGTDAQAYIFRSRGGGPWEKLGGGLAQPLDAMPYALLTDPRAPGHVYAGLRNGQVWHSADHGDDWARLPVDLGSVRSLVIL